MFTSFTGLVQIVTDRLRLVNMLKIAVLSLLAGLCAASRGHHSIELPIKSHHELDVIHSDSHVEDHSTHVDVPADVLPVYMTWKTQSSPLHVRQEHRNTKGSHQSSHSKDEPHRLVHEVVKPVIQELKEVITPYRKIVQVIEPVREERLTKVHKSEGHNNDRYGNDDHNDDHYRRSDNNDDHYRRDDNHYDRHDNDRRDSHSYH